MHVKSQDRVLSPCPFQPGDFGLQLVLGLRSPGLLLLLVLRLRLRLWLPLLSMVLSLLAVLSLMLRIVVWSVFVVLGRRGRQPLLSGPEALMGLPGLLLRGEPPGVRLLDGLGGRSHARWRRLLESSIDRSEAPLVVEAIAGALGGLVGEGRRGLGCAGGECGAIMTGRCARGVAPRRGAGGILVVNGSAIIHLRGPGRS